MSPSTIHSFLSTDTKGWLTPIWGPCATSTLFLAAPGMASRDLGVASLVEVGALGHQQQRRLGLEQCKQLRVGGVEAAVVEDLHQIEGAVDQLGGDRQDDVERQALHLIG